MKSKDPVDTLLELQRQSGSQTAWSSREMFWLFAAIFILAVLLVIWAVYIRKPKREYTGKKLITAPTHKSSHRRRRRRSRPSRPRNPTLAETGGLPPRKPQSDVPNSP